MSSPSSGRYTICESGPIWLRIACSVGAVKPSSSARRVSTNVAGSTWSLAGRGSVTKRYISVLETGFTPGLIWGPIHMVAVSISGGRGSTARHTAWPL